MYKRIFILGFALFLILIPASSVFADKAYTYQGDWDGDGTVDPADCAAGNPRIHPSAPDEYGDGIDQNCDNVDGVDLDKDGFAGEMDCNDSEPSIYPGATEVPGNGIDEDCDGLDKAG